MCVYVYMYVCINIYMYMCISAEMKILLSQLGRFLARTGQVPLSISLAL